MYVHVQAKVFLPVLWYGLFREFTVCVCVCVCVCLCVCVCVMRWGWDREVYCSDWWANVLVVMYMLVHVQGLPSCSVVWVVQGIYCVCGCRVRSLSYSG